MRQSQTTGDTISWGQGQTANLENTQQERRKDIVREHLELTGAQKERAVCGGWAQTESERRAKRAGGRRPVSGVLALQFRARTTARTEVEHRSHPLPGEVVYAGTLSAVWLGKAITNKERSKGQADDAAQRTRLWRWLPASRRHTGHFIYDPSACPLPHPQVQRPREGCEREGYEQSVDCSALRHSRLDTNAVWGKKNS